MNPGIDVSQGRQLDFEADGTPMSGKIMSSAIDDDPMYVSVMVWTGAPVPKGATLAIADCGGCGLAFPRLLSNGQFEVKVRPQFNYVDRTTIGR